MDLIEVCRCLGHAGMSAAPCPWLPAISIFDDDVYEGHDLDDLRPLDRLRIARVLREIGLRPRGARCFEGDGIRLELPRPPRSLASDPSTELLRVLERPGTIALASPTQVALATFRRAESALTEQRRRDLLDLVFEQPVNLEKVDRFARGEPWEADYQRLRAGLRARQAEGTDLRRRREFRSRLPR